ncbi:MAG: sulfide-dependent adenosine diphosphate thiazole synthase [Dehalococcoidales bacterium]|nr:sulfide-dependent adenosine diphosphate thiazole synthase [Dehalococcoidales bacterium]
MDEIVISQAIIRGYFDDFLKYMDVDVAIVSAGPSGLSAAYYLAGKGIKTVIYERKLSIGGGMWGGGMMFNRIVVQSDAKHILDEFDIKSEEFQPGYFVADSVEAVSTMCSKAIKSGACIFNLITVEDVMIRENNRITGLVLNWSAVDIAKLHVDPLTIRSKYVIDATGHDAEVCKIVVRKADAKLNTNTGGIDGERSMWAEVAEREVMNHTKEVCPGLFVAGMAANAVYGLPRMGPVFGGMLLSGRKAAELIAKELNKGIK